MASLSDDDSLLGLLHSQQRVERANFKDHAELEEELEEESDVVMNTAMKGTLDAQQEPCWNDNSTNNEQQCHMLLDSVVPKRVRTKEVGESKCCYDPKQATIHDTDLCIYGCKRDSVSGNLVETDTVYKCGGESNFFAKRFHGKYPRLLQFIPLEEKYQSIYKTDGEVHTLEPKYIKHKDWDPTPRRKRKR